MRNWYQFQVQGNAADADEAELTIFDEIGNSFFNDDAVTAKQFLQDLHQLPSSVKNILVRVNSPGGDVFDAVAIASALRDQQRAKGRTVRARIEGLAASAATIVTCACRPIEIVENGVMFVHDPQAVQSGTSEDMRRAAEGLDRIKDSIIAAYQWSSSKAPAELSKLMSDATWMDPPEALANGFVTEIVHDGLKASALVPFRSEALMFVGAIPDRFREAAAIFTRPPVDSAPPARRNYRPVQGDVASVADVLRLCRDGGCLDDLANKLLADQATLAEVQARIAAVGQERAAASARAQAITRFCAGAHLPELAASYIAGGMPPDEVRAQLVTITARMDGRVEIDTSIVPGDHRPGFRQATADPNRLYGKGAAQ